VFLWMSFNAPAVYRTMRNALGVATFTALLFFAFVPLAPPRLTEASGMVDSYARVGLVHGFVNQYAAMPSLHVGWMALAGWGLARAIGGWKGRVIGIVPPAVMMVTVVVTGNHYWLDGIVGSILCVTPAILFDRLRTAPATERVIPTVVVPSPIRSPRPATYITIPAVSGGDHAESREPVGQHSAR
ncbi:MAG: phosphatase PAP2 family protein, partial [Thermomicrobiales bacterium]